MKTRILLLLLLTGLCAPAYLNAQGQYYRFSQSNETYTDLVNPVVLDSMVFATGNSHFLPLTGETFTFYGVPFPMGGLKTVLLEPNGNLRIDNDSTLIIIDGAFTWLDSIDLNSSVSYLIEGSSGNKVLKAQWKNLRVRVGDPSNFMNLQIWVYQASGVVEIRYGASDNSNRSGFGTSDGPQVGMFFARDDFSRLYEKLWVTGSPSTIKLDSARSFTFNAMSGIPEEGKVFRFEPKLLSAGREINELAVVLYPNPAGNNVHFEGLKENARLNVYDLNGKLLMEKDLDAMNTELEITALANGLYTWTLSAEGAISRGRLMVNR